MELISALGLEPKIILAQLLNFVILLGILYAFGYKPILKFIRERTAKIEEGVKNATNAATAVEQARKETDQILTDARKEAAQILTSAREQSEKNAEGMREKAKQDLKVIAERAKESIHEERNKMMRETRQEAIALVVQTTERILNEKLDAKKDTALIQRMLEEVKE